MVGGGVFRSVLSRVLEIDSGFAVFLFLVQAQAVQKGRLSVGGILVQHLPQPDPDGPRGTGSQKVQHLPQIASQGRGGAFSGHIERFGRLFGVRFGGFVASENERHGPKHQHSPFGRGAIT